MKRLPFRLNPFAQGALSKAARVRHWLFNFATLISLLIFTGSAVTWPISYYRGTESVWPLGRNSQLEIVVLPGTLDLVHFFSGFDISTVHYGLESWNGGPRSLFAIREASDGLHVLGFAWTSGDIETWAPRTITLQARSKHTGALLPLSLSGPNEHYRRFGVPFWFLLLISAWPIILWFNRRYCARLSPRNYKACGYDLRATRDRCPECGTMLSGQHDSTGDVLPAHGP